MGGGHFIKYSKPITKKIFYIRKIKEIFLTNSRFGALIDLEKYTLKYKISYAP